MSTPTTQSTRPPPFRGKVDVQVTGPNPFPNPMPSPLTVTVQASPGSATTTISGTLSYINSFNVEVDAVTQGTPTAQVGVFTFTFAVPPDAVAGNGVYFLFKARNGNDLGGAAYSSAFPS
jgi:hypothetical protein